MDSRVTEFQCIMPMENIPSVLRHGILCYEQTAKLPHRSVAMQPVQDRRDIKRVPGGRMLHQYANLYFHARNPMMYSRQREAPQICILRVSTAVADLDGVVLADRNASSDWVRFLHPSQAAVLDFDAIYALDWTHPDRFEYFARKSKKCAEVLVPDCVEPKFLTGAYVVEGAAVAQLAAHGFALPVQVEPMLFFR
jgi:ssDNA thymidine ADP-ribosyltransferase, DarT